jgi:signal transduction histidine kinase
MRDIVRLGAAVVLIGGVLSVLALVRLRRERREAESRLRRSDRLAVLGMMAASVAHELNNPLATISGCASAVRDRLRRREGAAPADAGAGDSHADELEYLDMIVDETRRCSGIARSLRDLARDTPPAMIPTDLAALARDVVGLVGMAREGPKVTVECGGDASLEIVCDPDKIKQLLLNLVVNARDACADGGHVRIAVERAGDDAARLVVEDDGQGIAPQDLSRVFEPFHTGKTRGLGLGLFICERIATLHGGAISASSEGPGRGARFSVTLPTHPPLRAPATAEAAATA